ncbi:MAG: regulatory signaling modulator protein AmpE [Gammaproteobacteria bacterium]|nr:regulatory signaling modulator protein AmpE [Gammaproteobacteria bacterium]
MNLIALLIGLAVERVATQWFHWRRMRWLDHIIDWGFAFAARFASWPALIFIVLLALILVLPVFVVIMLLGGTLAGFTYLLLAVVLLFFSLGPHDIGEEVDEYCSALESENHDDIVHTAKAIVENDLPEDPLALIRRVEESVCVQANNRLFAVIFWFVVLGPLAAWAYRATDLIRRRAMFNAARSEPDDEIAPRVRDAAAALHGWLAWIPARLTAFGYATAGHFDEAIAAMRAPVEQHDASTSEHNEKLLARVGVAALALHEDPGESITARGVRGAAAAKQLVFRQLMIWVVIISLMTLYGLTQ